MSGSPNETPRLQRPQRKRRPAQWNAKPKVGDKLGAFRLLQVLGEGGAGAVYRAEHDFLKRPVAIKVLHPELSARPGMVARFFQEALAVNKARHPNIIDITDVVASETSPPYIVMELLVGEDLGDYIDKYSPVAVSEAIPILRQICDAMATVHDLGIVHRDLKPENIFLVTKPKQNSSGQGASGQDSSVPIVKLLDFGIAKFLHSDENRRRTWSGGVLGTPAYMPMEQLHGLPVDHRADIYALGVVTYEMLTGRLPFEIDSMEDLSNQRLTLEPPPPSTRPIHHPPEPITPAIDRVVLRALNDDPSKRFQHVLDYRSALLDALEAASADEAATPPHTDLAPEVHAPAPPDDATAPPLAALPPLPSASPEPRRKRGRRWLVSSAAALLLGLGALIWLQRRSPDSPRPPSERQVVGQGRAQVSTARSRAASIQILSHPSHARIHAGDTGAFLGQTPAAVPVTAGQARILDLRLPGHKTMRITVTPDGPNPVQVWLEPLALAPRTAPTDATAPPRSRIQIRYVRVRDRARPAPRPRSTLRNVSDQGIVDPFHRHQSRATP